MKSIIGLIALSFSFLFGEEGFKLYGLSGDVASDGSTYILLVWTAKEGIEGFNLYRREEGENEYSRLNETPLSIMRNCRRIEAILTDEEEGVFKSIGVNPCSVYTLKPTDPAYKVLQSFSFSYWRIGILTGQAYVDSSVVNGTTYWYKIEGIDEKRAETVLDSVQVTAGDVTPLPSPSNLTAEAGDNSVLLRWDRMDDAFGFEVFRSTSSTATGKRVNEPLMVSQCSTAAGTVNCFLDYQRWDDAGRPIKHLVGSDSIEGPSNGITYWYRVRALDLLKREGDFSAPVPATPHDTTPPRVPRDVRVEALKDTLEVRWLKVTHNVLGHLDTIQNYRVYRCDSSQDTAGTQVGVIPQPTGEETTFVFFRDGDTAVLRPDYGEKVFWYRVQAIDKYGNESRKSSPVAGHLKDITPPAPPKGLNAEGDTNFIKLNWERNTEPDLGGYMLYRGICNKYNICDSVCVDSVRVDSEGIQGEREKWECKKWKYLPCPLLLIAKIDNPDSTYYEDHTVPLGSPICYRYAVKAYDKTQNLSDTSETVCQRLREKVPPPPPILAGLKARNLGIKVEWIVAPVQDLFGFVVERSETDSGPWEQVSPELIFPEVFGCEDIPATNIWAQDSIFSFLDTTVEAKKTYWYRVKAADYGGNIGEPSAPVETYTFDITPPPTPGILSVAQPPGECALTIEWSPPYDTTYLGFVVFRSLKRDCCYRQISPIIQGNEFTDEKVIPGREYWYKIQYFGRNGNRSLVSDPKNGIVTAP